MWLMCGMLAGTRAAALTVLGLSGKGGKREPSLGGGKALDLGRRLLRSKPSKPPSCLCPSVPY